MLSSFFCTDFSFRFCHRLLEPTKAGEREKDRQILQLIFFFFLFVCLHGKKAEYVQQLNWLWETCVLGFRLIDVPFHMLNLFVIVITIIAGIVFRWWSKLIFLASFATTRCWFTRLLSFWRFLHCVAYRHRFWCCGQRWCRITVAIHHILHGMEWILSIFFCFFLWRIQSVCYCYVDIWSKFQKKKKERKEICSRR